MSSVKEEALHRDAANRLLGGKDLLLWGDMVSCPRNQRHRAAHRSEPHGLSLNLKASLEESVLSKELLHGAQVHGPGQVFLVAIPGLQLVIARTERLFVCVLPQVEPPLRPSLPRFEGIEAGPDEAPAHYSASQGDHGLEPELRGGAHESRQRSVAGMEVDWAGSQGQSEHPAGLAGSDDN